MTTENIALPEARTLADLFDEIAPWPKGVNVKPTIAPEVIEATDWIGSIGEAQPHRAKMEVGPYCHVRNGGSLAVHPNQDVMRVIRERMIFVGHDRMHFEIIPWDDGRALVTVNYGQIIGSRWLAIIDGDDVLATFGRVYAAVESA